MIDDEEKRGRQRQERKCQCKIGENEDCRLVFIWLWSFKFSPIKLTTHYLHKNQHNQQISTVSYCGYIPQIREQMSGPEIS
jgi:hypothetical protein